MLDALWVQYLCRLLVYVGSFPVVLSISPIFWAFIITIKYTTNHSLTSPGILVETVQSFNGTHRPSVFSRNITNRCPCCIRFGRYDSAYLGHSKWSAGLQVIRSYRLGTFCGVLFWRDERRIGLWRYNAPGLGFDLPKICTASLRTYQAD